MTDSITMTLWRPAGLPKWSWSGPTAGPPEQPIFHPSLA
jgi:hypothetical protein